jgi:hypothetical protein
MMKSSTRYGHRFTKFRSDGLPLGRLVPGLSAWRGLMSGGPISDLRAYARRWNLVHDGLTSVGVVQQATGISSAAIASLTHALKLYTKLGSQLGQASALTEIGTVHAAAGDYTAAASAQQHALDLYRYVGDRLGEANTLTSLGIVQFRTGDSAAAEASHTRALQLYRDLDDRSGEAEALNNIADMISRTAAPATARPYYEQALAIAISITAQHEQARITGEVGAGKKVSVRTVLAGLDASRHVIIYLPNPVIGVRGIHETVVATFGGTPDRSGFHLAPWTPPDGTEVTLAGPNTPAAGWRRARGIINGKAQDWVGSPVPVWLRFDLLDGTWLFSDWAQRSLPDKTEWMAALVAEAVADTGVVGAVVSTGPALDPKAAEGHCIGTGGAVGLSLDLSRP